EKLYVPGVGFGHRPYVDPEQIRRGDHIPVMDGRYVFKMATSRMIEVSQELLKRNGLAPGDLAMVLMHQANKRINEYCQKALGLPDEKVPHNIHKYGNTTAGTIPLLWDECVRAGRLRPGPGAPRGLRRGDELGRDARAGMTTMAARATRRPLCRMAAAVLVLSFAAAASAQEPLRVGGVTARPGEKASGWLEVPDGIDSGARLPVSVL